MMLVIIILISDKVIIIENLFTASLITSHNSPYHQRVSVVQWLKSAKVQNPKAQGSVPHQPRGYLCPELAT